MTRRPGPEPAHAAARALAGRARGGRLHRHRLVPQRRVGTMCPPYPSTRDERLTVRGLADLLRDGADWRDPIYNPGLGKAPAHLHRLQGQPHRVPGRRRYGLDQGAAPRRTSRRGRRRVARAGVRGPPTTLARLARCRARRTSWRARRSASCSARRRLGSTRNRRLPLLSTRTFRDLTHGRYGPRRATSRCSRHLHAVAGARHRPRRARLPRRCRRPPRGGAERVLRPHLHLGRHARRGPAARRSRTSAGCCRSRPAACPSSASSRRDPDRCATSSRSCCRATTTRAPSRAAVRFSRRRSDRPGDAAAETRSEAAVIVHPHCHTKALARPGRRPRRSGASPPPGSRCSTRLLRHGRLLRLPQRDLRPLGRDGEGPPRAGRNANPDAIVVAQGMRAVARSPTSLRAAPCIRRSCWPISSPAEPPPRGSAGPPAPARRSPTGR